MMVLNFPSGCQDMSLTVVAIFVHFILLFDPKRQDQINGSLQSFLSFRLT